MPFEHDRQFYRLMYPPQAAPVFVEGATEHRIVDIGEGGFRYALATQPGPLVGVEVKGVIRFPEGEDPLAVEGVVVRTGAVEIAVHCNTRSIPLPIVMREQRRLRRKYPFRN